MLGLAFLLSGCTKTSTDIPFWLTEYEKQYKEDPLEASREWFVDAKLGMFVHFNAASLLELGGIDYKLWSRGQADERILDYVGVSREEYEKAQRKDSLLYTRFEIPEFDAEKICQLAVKAKMKYITFTAHHMSATFDSEYLTINSVNTSPSGRDLVAEMIAACEKYDLAPFLYMRGSYKSAYSSNQPEKLAILKEILSNYGPLAGIWFDGGPADEEVNDFIKEIQPQCLVSFKHGIGTCGEDYISPEFYMLPFKYEFQTEGQQHRWNINNRKWEEREKENWEKCGKYKLREICSTMMGAKWRD